MLQTIAGGANARPFTTHHHALDLPMKLRISLELYLKRMLVGGVERVYELGRNFRNEGIDRDHNPEFTMLEVYQAYGDYHTMMELSETLVRACCRAVNPIVGRAADDLVIPVRDRTIDLAEPFARITVLGAVSEAVGEPITLEHADLPGVAARNQVPIDDAWGPGKIVQELFEKLVEETIEQPTFVCDFPREVSPLARPHRDNPGLTEHFDLVAAGVELVTAFSELDRSGRAAREVRAPTADEGRARRRGASLRRGVPAGAGARDATGRRPGDGHRPPPVGAAGRPEPPRSDHVPDAAARVMRAGPDLRRPAVRCIVAPVTELLREIDGPH